MARLPARIARWAAGLIGLLLLLVAVGLLALTQTDSGRRLVAGFVEGRLQDAVSEGRVRVGRIEGGNLLTRVVVDSLVIEGPEGRTFVALEGVRLEYDPTGFLRQDFTFRGMEVESGLIQLLQDEDGTWNFDRIFAPAGDDGAGGDLRLAFHDVRIDSGRLLVRQPYGTELTGEARTRAVREAVRGESIWRLETDPDGGIVRLIELTEMRGRFPLLRIQDPERPMRIVIEDLSGVARAVSRPLPVLRFDGDVTFGDTIRVGIEEARLPASRIAGEGWVVDTEAGQRYRFDLRGDPIGFADLQWLPLPVPDEGGGPMEVVFRSEGEVPVLEVDEGRVRVGETEIRGGFALALTDPAAFRSLDVVFDPLQFDLVTDLLELEEGPRGAYVGTLAGSGPIDRFRLRAEGALRPAGGGEASGIRAAGGVSLVEPYAFDALRVGVDDLPVTWIEAFGFEVPIEGDLGGEVTLSGVPGGRMAFEADVLHTPLAGTPSRVRGSGSVDLAAAEPEVDASLTLDPLALSLLDPYLPELDLVGIVRGTVTARGRLSDLEAGADLRTPRGRIALEGDFDLASEPRSWDARVTAREIDLRQWAEDLPESRLAVTGRVEGRGTDPAALQGSFELRVLPSTLAGIGIDTSTVHFTLAEGLARLDTLALDTDVGTVRGRGTLGLVPEESGTLEFDLRIPELVALDRWLRGPPQAAPAEEEDLFAELARPLEGQEPGQPAISRDSLAGSVEARALLAGNLEDFSLELAARGAGLVYDGYVADSVSARLEVPDPRSPDSLTLEAHALGVQAQGVRLDSVDARVVRLGADTASVGLFAIRDTTLEVGMEAGLVWGERRAASLRDFHLLVGGHRLTLAGPAELAYDESGLTVDGLILHGSGGELVRVDGQLPREGSGELEVVVEEVHLAEITELLPDPPDVAGVLGAAVRVRGTAAAPRMQGTLRIRDPSFASASYALLEGEFGYEDRRLEGGLVLRGTAEPVVTVEGSIGVDLALEEVEDRLADEPLDLRLSADSLPLQVLQLLTDGLADVEGTARTDVRVTGAPGDLAFDGEVRVVGGAATVPDLRVRYSGIRGLVVLEGSSARVDSLVLHTRDGGRAVVSGGLELADFTDPGLDLDIVARGLQGIDTREMSFRLTGQARLEGAYRRPEVTGSLRIHAGEVRQDDLLRRGDVVDLTDPDVLSLIDTTIVAERELLEEAQNPFMENLSAQLTVALGPDLWLRSPSLNVEVAAEGLEVRMDRADELLQVTGTVRLVRGTYVLDFRGITGQELRLTSGTVEFVGTPGLNPNLDVVAEFRTRTRETAVTIDVTLTGTLEDSQVVLESDPPMTESDQLCFLAVGARCAAAGDPTLASRLGPELAFGAISSQLSRAIGGEVGLDYLSLRTGATTDGETAGFGGFFAGAELEVGKYLGNEFFATYTQPLGGFGITEWTVEWQFDENWTLQARTGSILGRQVGFLPSSGLEDQRTFGLSLFREWSF